MSENINAGKTDARELVGLIRAGDQSAFERLLTQYEPMLRAVVNRYSFDGQDMDDSRQEALAGFYRAVLSFDIGQPGVAFGLYAKICVTNALISHAREARRRTCETAGAVEYEDCIKYRVDSEADPAERIIEQENEKALRELIERNLSRFENMVWDMYISGETSAQIANRLGKPEKSIDNALYRIRRKLRALLENYGS